MKVAFLLSNSLHHSSQNNTSSTVQKKGEVFLKNPPPSFTTKPVNYNYNSA
jgi:hypothetical protein